MANIIPKRFMKGVLSTLIPINGNTYTNATVGITVGVTYQWTATISAITAQTHSYPIPINGNSGYYDGKNVAVGDYVASPNGQSLKIISISAQSTSSVSVTLEDTDAHNYITYDTQDGSIPSGSCYILEMDAVGSPHINGTIASSLHGDSILLATYLKSTASNKGIRSPSLSEVNSLISTATTSLTGSTIASSLLGAANGVATLGSDGKVPSTQLPSFVDDVLEYVNLAGFPVTGETSKIYVDLATNKTYRWSGSAYVAVNSAGTADTAVKLLTPRSISLTGDVNYTTTFDGSANATGTATLANTTVTAGSYGSATNIPVITVDNKGRLTNASTVAVSIPSGSISVTGGDLTLSGTTGTAITNATLANSGVTAGTYTQVTVDAKGRVTSGTSIANATTTVSGLFSNIDKTKLDGIAANANNYSLPIASNTVLGGIKIGSGLSIDGTGMVTVASSGTSVSNDIATASELYPTFIDISTGSMSTVKVASSKLTYNPSTGTLTSVEFNTTSDLRLKENVKPLVYGLNRINEINTKTYNYIADTNKKLRYGVIAQEIEKVLPDVVTTKEDGYKAVNYVDIIPVLIKAIQELSKQVDELKMSVNQ